jgi:hypothetical protein
MSARDNEIQVAVERRQTMFLAAALAAAISLRNSSVTIVKSLHDRS